MTETRIAKLLSDGANQVVRLPAEFRFEGDEVYATRDDATGDIVLSKHPGATTWGVFFELVRTVEIPDDFMEERPMNTVSQDRTDQPRTQKSDP